MKTVSIPVCLFMMALLAWGVVCVTNDWSDFLLYGVSVAIMVVILGGYLLWWMKPKKKDGK